MRLANFLAERRVTFEILVHPPAFTAQKRAKFLHWPGKRVVKSVLLTGPGGHVVAMLPATHHVDTDALARALGGPLRLADSREIAQAFPDCEYGVVPPFGSLYGFATIIDETLEPDALMVCEGHTHAEAIRLRCRDFEDLERPRRLRFTRPCMTPRRLCSSAC
jgi:Ala-tRNA(Pro) deacylase